MLQKLKSWPSFLQLSLFILAVSTALFSIYSGDIRYLIGFSSALALALGFIWAFTNFNFLTALVVLTIPLSVKISFGGFVLAIPAEGMLAAVAVIFLFRVIAFKSLDKRILLHPITILLFFEFTWMLISSLFSTMPDISLKRTALRLLYLIVLYLLMANWFKRPSNRPLFFILLIIGVIPVAIITMINHAQLNFSFHDAYLVTRPFFDDHTVYGAFIAFLLPFSIIAFIKPRVFKFPTMVSLVLLPIVGFLFLAEYLSFSRAAWLSLAGSSLLFFLIRIRISFRTILFTILAGSAVLIGQFDVIYDQAKQNEAVSNTNEISQQIKSVTNVSTDNSNLERINRWKCAWRMGNEKPLLGFGPGTYQFQYGQFQIPIEKTYLGTYNGDKGNAHSDYLTAFSENGWPGFFLFISWVLFSVYLGLKIIYRTKNEQIKWLAIVTLTGLLTFFLHGWVNTFLDQVKIATLVFGSLALLTILDLQQRKENN